MQRPTHILRIALAVSLSAAAPFALAQAYSSTAQTPPHPQSGAVTHTPPFKSAPLNNTNQKQLPAPLPGGKTGLLGAHDMSGTVESVSQSGIVEVKTDDGTLKLHFPKASQNLKKGEKITLHLSYSLPAPPASAPASASSASK